VRRGVRTRLFKGVFAIGMERSGEEVGVVKDQLRS